MRCSRIAGCGLALAAWIVTATADAACAPAPGERPVMGHLTQTLDPPTLLAQADDSSEPDPVPAPKPPKTAKKSAATPTKPAVSAKKAVPKKEESSKQKPAPEEKSPSEKKSGEVPATPSPKAEAEKTPPKPKKPPPVPAKRLFGAAKAPAPLTARAIGSYAKGCLAGAAPLSIDGPAWQAMRLSRNRNWGHPKLIALIQKFATEVKKEDGWNGLLVGDISQPRGGPMLTGHASHQVGLDADVWLTPMPKRKLSKKERETIAATSMLASDDVSVNPEVWTEAHYRILKRAASYPEVERVLVHPAIKKALCDLADKADKADTDAGKTKPDKSHRQWLSKTRPIYGHYYHFHIRIGCPPGSGGCQSQKPPPTDDGCGKEVADWLALVKPKPAKPRPPKPPGEKPKPIPAKPPLTLDQLPSECRIVLESGQTPKATPAAKAASGK